MLRYILLLIIIALGVYSQAQEYHVESFEIAPKDLSARTEGRVDGNGRKCAVIKVYVKDTITEIDGPVVGEIRDRGIEKWIYVSHDAKHIELLFKEHIPLQITFADYDYPTVTGQMTYLLRLTEISKVSTADIESNNIIQILPETTTFGESVNYETISDTHYTPIPEIDKNLYDAWRYGYKKEFFNIINSKPDYAGCQYYIGLTYRTGMWNNRNDEEALKMFTLAALQEHLQSQEEVGKLYSIYSTLPKEKRMRKNLHIGTLKLQIKEVQQLNYKWVNII